MIQNALLPLAFATLAAGLAQADTYYIDDDGGVGIDYTTIQPAIDVANHGDILIVHPGNYSGFSLGKGLTILGSEASDTCVITSHTTISSVPGPRRAILTGLRMQTVSVSNNPGHVILDSLNISPSIPAAAALAINSSTDVRMYECYVRATVNTPFFVSGNAVQVLSSRFEAINCEFIGGTGSQGDCYLDGGDAGDGLWASRSSKLAIFQTHCAGGPGGDTEDFCEWVDPIAGDGGNGMYMRGGSSAVIAGPPTTLIEWGRGGYGDCFPSCYDGDAGMGLVVEGGSEVRHSGVGLTTVDVAPGSMLTTVAPSDPYLERFGTLQAGRLQTFYVYGEPGDQVTFYIGRAPTIVEDPTQFMDDLVSHQRSYNLGTINASGRKQFNFTIPTSFPPAFNFYVQAATTDTGGQRTLTNSMPLVLRHLP